MDLYIGNLPDRITPRELENFFGRLQRQLTLEFRDYQRPDGSRSRFAIARCQNERQARKLIDKFNRRPLQGQPLHIREFFHRSYANERRALGWRNRPWHDIERRTEERRVHDSYLTPDSFEDILQGVPQAEQSPDSLLIRAYRNIARKF